MKQRGHAVSALVPEYDFMPEVESLGIPYRKIQLSRSNLNPLQELASRRELQRVIANEQPDVVFAYTIKPIVQGVPAARKAGVKQVFAMITGMGYLFTGESLKQRLLRQIARILYTSSLKQCDGIFFQNPDDIQLFRSMGIVRHHQNIHMTNGSGVSLQTFPRVPMPTANTRSPIVFLMIARLLQDKGVAEYVQAAQMLKSEYGDKVCFQLVGPYDPNLPHAVRPEDHKAWQQDNAVTFAGHQADVKPWLAGCHVYVLPSYREGTPRSVLEAMATGRPVITTDAPGCRETVEEGENGFIVPPRTIAPLAQAMKRFVDHPALISEMGQKSYELVTEKYEVSRVNAGILHVMGL